jgi:MerR family transcriptional regulator, light-induced transcriptional regulator
VARLTGLSADIIRAWEKRYGVVEPVRGPRGARLYSAADVEHLRLLGRVVDSGRAIGDVARLTPQDLRALVGAERTPPPAASTDSAAAVNGVVGYVLAALEEDNVARMDQALGEALLVLGMREFVRQIVCPLLKAVGDRWERGELSVADEHLVSGVLRNLLTGLLRTRSATRGPLILLATSAGERHEFGLLIAALVLLDGGCRLHYLGVDLPVQEIAAAAQRASVTVVGVGVVNGENHRNAVQQLRLLDRLLSPATELWLGGREAKAVAQALHSARIRVVDDLESLQLHAGRLGAAGLRGSVEHEQPKTTA